MVFDERAGGQQNGEVFSVTAVPVAALSVRASTGSEFGIEPKLQESIELVGRLEPDRAAVSAVAA
jgi:hypothetical protein